MQLLERTFAATNVNFDNLKDALNPTVTSAPSLGGIITNVIAVLIYVAGVLAFVYLVYSGILYLTAAGNPDAAKKGQQGIINAVIGIVIIVLAYIILHAISTGASSAATGGNIS